MKAEIITIGDELLIGQTIDTNSAWIGTEMSQAGFDISRIVSIHDNREDILNSLSGIDDNTVVVLITGGLGPTSDDITKQTLCEFFDTHPVTDKDALSMIERIVHHRRIPMNENNRRQAEVPESCRVLLNAMGTAPGMWFEKDNTIFISMPGVPYEMKYIMTKHVIPELKRRFRSQNIIHRNIMTYGTYEAKLAEILSGFERGLPGNIKLAYLPSSGIIKLRLTCTGKDRHLMTEQVGKEVKKLYEVIPDFIYGEDEESLESVIGRLLTDGKKTVSTAESCTGGRIAHLITGIPGSSKYFKGSVIAYSNEVKISLLGVREKTLDAYGAVSENVAGEMAEGARKLLQTDYAVATSGVAGPDGGSTEKPVGTIWIAVASGNGTVTEKHIFGRERSTNIHRFSLAALNMLRKQLIRP